MMPRSKEKVKCGGLLFSSQSLWEGDQGDLKGDLAYL